MSHNVHWISDFKRSDMDNLILKYPSNFLYLDIARERVPLDAANFQKESCLKSLNSVATIELPNSDRDINLMVR